jgi:hypothetical protein
MQCMYTSIEVRRIDISEQDYLNLIPLIVYFLMIKLLLIMDFIWILLLPLLVPYLIGRAEQVLRSVLENRNEK